MRFLGLFAPRLDNLKKPVDEYVGIRSHVKLKNSSWSGFTGWVVDQYHDGDGVLIFEIYIDPSGPGQLGGPNVPADISQLDVLS